MPTGRARAVTTTDRFQEAQDRVKALRRTPGTPDLLALYSLYKQATVGDASEKGRPGILDPRTGRVTNWFAARTFEEQRRADDLQFATGRSPFFVGAIVDPAQRAARLNEALVATARIILLGLVMDGIYQAIEFKAFHPAEAVIIALMLAFVPYVLLRGLISRAARCIPLMAARTTWLAQIAMEKPYWRKTSVGVE